jgi:hypothetical protein
MLQCRSAASRVRRQYLGLLDYLGCVGHGIFPGKPKGSESKTASCPVKALRAWLEATRPETSPRGETNVNRDEPGPSGRALSCRARWACSWSA